MNRLDDPESGITFSRIGLAAGVVVSVAGNVANTIYLTNHADVAWRIPGAVVWPPFLFLGIEIMVRNRHRKAFTGYLARLLLMLVSVATFITSYVNLHAFMVKTDEPFLATYAGPVGIDGLMLGSTLMLLAASMKAGVLPTAGLQYAKPIGPMPALNAHAIAAEVADLSLAEADREFTLAAMMAPATVQDVAPISAPPARARTPRVQWDMAQVVELAVDNAKNSDAKAATGMGESTFGRYKTVAALLRANGNAQIDPAKARVSPEHIEMIRRRINR